MDEFYRTFPSERRCWEPLRRLRWPNGFRCPRCEEREAHRLRARGLWQCAGCRHEVSLAAGTPFHGTRVPLRTWFLAMFFVARHKHGISALRFQSDAGLGSHETARTLLHKLRSALAHNPRFPLEGDVEVDAGGSASSSASSYAESWRANRVPTNSSWRSERHRQRTSKVGASLHVRVWT